MNDLTELGDLTPIRELAEHLREWEEQDRQRRQDGDPVLHTLAKVRTQLTKALDDATGVDLTLSVEEYAKAEGVTPAAIYKRLQRGRLPGARRRGGRIHIRASQAA